MNQGFAKLASNFIPITPIVPVTQPKPGITAWEAVLIVVICVAFGVSAIALSRWWSE